MYHFYYIEWTEKSVILLGNHLTQGSYFLEYQHKKLHYQVFGSGNSVYLAFHGMHQSGNVFKSFASTNKEVCIIAFDFYNHGKSDTVRPQPLEKEFIQFIRSELIRKHQLKAFNLIGFSLGARMVMAWLDADCTLLRDVVLIAPEGMNKINLMRLATSRGLFRYLFRCFIFKPALVLTLIRLVHVLRLVNQGLSRLLMAQVKTRSLRYKLYSTWMLLREFDWHRSNISGLLLHNDGIKIRLIYSAQDELLSSYTFKRIGKKNKVHVMEINGSHQNLLSNAVQAFSLEK